MSTVGEKKMPEDSASVWDITSKVLGCSGRSLTSPAFDVHGDKSILSVLKPRYSKEYRNLLHSTHHMHEFIQTLHLYAYQT